MSDEPKIVLSQEAAQLTPFEKEYQKHPKAEEQALLSQSAVERIVGIMANLGWTGKRLRKELGWSKRKWNRIAKDGRIAMRQLSQVLYVMGYRAAITTTPIPAELRKLTHGEPEPVPTLES